MKLRDPWQIYDGLLDLIPAELMVTDLAVSRVSLVGNSAGGVGVASADRSGQRLRHHDRQLIGKPLRELASLVRSWDFELASIGVAAMNSWFNSVDRLEQLATDSAMRLDQSDCDVLTSRAEELAGHKVALIGHFEHGINALSGVCDLTVLERDPKGSDLPDSACEYLLPGMDIIFITGMTVANKTLPRLLDLAGDAQIILVGPSVPCAPEVFRGRVSQLAGSCVVDAVLARSLVSIGAGMPEISPTTTRFVLTL